MPTFINGSALDDILIGVDGVDIWRGLGGNDTITGSRNRSGTVLDGGDGDDILTTGLTGFNSTVRGGSGSYTSPQGNTALGGNGNDTLTGGPGDTLIGGAGNDVINFGYRANYFGGPSHLPGRVDGGDGIDTITVNAAAAIDAGAGNDRITYSSSREFLDDGISTLRTGAGADIIEVYFGSFNAFATRVLDFTMTGPERDTLQAYGIGNFDFLGGNHRLMQQGSDTLIMLGQLTEVVVLANVRAADLTAVHLGGANPGGVIWTAGGRGDDVLMGTADIDRIYGSLGDDVITGAVGNDIIEGGVGIDTAVFSGNRADYSWTGSGDYFVVTDLRAGLTDGVDTLVGVEILRFADQSVAIYAPRTQFVGTEAANSFSGSSNNDVLIGGGGADVMSGGVGRDIFRYLAATDFAVGEYVFDFAAGEDRFDFSGLGAARVRINQDFDFATVTMIIGGAQVQTAAQGYLAGGDLIGLSAGVAMTGTDDWADALVGGALGDRLYGFDGDDSLSGLAGDDGLMGGLGADVLEGGAGADVLIGGLGIDRMTGGAGADVFAFYNVADSTVAASDIITDFQTGVDRIDLSALGIAAPFLTFTAEGGMTRVSGFHPQGTLSFLVSGAITASDIAVNRGPAIVGTTASEGLTGTVLAEIITGGQGADLISGGYGADVFRYLAVTDSDDTGSDDILDFETGVDRLDLTALATTGISLIRYQDSTLLFGTAAGGSFRLASLGFDLNGSDIAFSTSHGVFMGGSDAADVMQGSDRADQIVGGGGNDVLTGAGGGDTLTGGAGADTFSYLRRADTTASASDVITDFVSGTDRIDLTGIGATSVSVARLAGGHSVIFAETATGAFQLFSQSAIVNASDIETGQIGVFMIGGDGADTMVGTVIADPLLGGAGDDILTGGIGADAIAGGAGRDIYRYTSFMDSCSALGVDNLYDFTSGEDIIDLRPVVTDNFSGELSKLTILRLEDGSSILFTGGYYSSMAQMAISAVGRDINPSDILYTRGAPGPYGVTVLGVSRSETMVGGTGNDELYGRAGDDILIGGGGNDTLYGEAGADRFVYQAGSDSVVAFGDVIIGFTAGEDKIDLRQVRTGGGDTYGIAFAGGWSYLFVDLGGDGVNDMRILLSNYTMTASDILWTPSGAAEETPVKVVGPEVLPLEDGVELDGLDAPAGNSGRFMLDLNLDPDIGRGFYHGQDWYL